MGECVGDEWCGNWPGDGIGFFSTTRFLHQRKWWTFFKFKIAYLATRSGKLQLCHNCFIQVPSHIWAHPPKTVEILSDSFRKMKNTIFEIMIDLVFHYINVNILLFLHLSWSLWNHWFILNINILFRTENFKKIFDVFLALWKIIHIYLIVVPCYGNVFRWFFYFKLMPFFSFSAHQMVCNA